MFIKALILFALLAAGVFCLRKMVTVKPYKLKKEDPFRIFFRKDLPNTELSEELTCMIPNKSNLTGSVIFGLLIIIVTIVGIILKDISYAFYLIPLILVLLQTLDEGTKRVHIYHYGIIVKSILRNKSYSFNELDYLESFNILNLFHKGISYGYRFMKDNQVIVSMDIRQYPEVIHIESVFEKLTDVIEEQSENAWYNYDEDEESI